MIIIVFGLPGSGKSFFASQLAEKLQAQYVNSDELRLQMLPTRRYTDAEKRRVYDAMLDAMTEAIVQKTPIILDATFYKAVIREKFEDAASALGEKILYIEVKAPESLIEKRLKKPRRYSEADFNVYLKLKETAEPLLRDHLVLVSSNENIEHMLQAAMEHILTHP